MIDARTRTQIARFVMVGLVATCADAGTYSLALSTVLAEGSAISVLLQGGRYSPSKALAFVVGTTVAYLLNTRWTFQVRERTSRQTMQFLALYGLSFAVNVGMNRASLTALFGAGLDEPVAAPIAFVVATGCSTVLTFVGQKLWVFPDRGPSIVT